MSLPRWFQLAGTIVALGLAGVMAAEPSARAKMSIAAPGDWVRERQWTRPAAALVAAKGEDQRILLYERQDHREREERFVRVAKLMQNDAGVQDSGSLSLSFDPSYEQMVLHRVTLHRDGAALDRLDAAKIKIIQPEADLDSHVLTGEHRAVLILEDLRVGDVLEYAYTIRGSNPVLQGHYAARIRVQSGIVVDRQRVRIVSTRPDALRFRQHLNETPPREILTEAGRELIWDADDVKPIPREDLLPTGFEAHPYVELSDFANWSEVVAWAVPLYRFDDTALPPELAAQIERWRAEGKTTEEKARLALQFVQDELRYTGLELGPDSYRPAHPFETFQKRFGDCKGKVALLCLIYRELGLVAQPALVHTSSREALGRRLPSPFAFNHVIVRVQIDGETLWLDPTRSHQGGTLAHRYLPAYAKALVVSDGVTALEDVPAPDPKQNGQRTYAHFRSKEFAAPATFTTKTTHRGYSADDLRETLSRTKLADLSKDYLNFYAKYYPGIQADGAPQVSDDRLHNEVVLTERYTIRELWRATEAGKPRKAEFVPDSLFGVLSDPNTRLRTMPLWISHPVSRVHQIEVELPRAKWAFQADASSVAHDAFEFKFRQRFNGTTLHLDYELSTKVREIPADQVAGFLAKKKEMDGLTGDTLTEPATEATNAANGMADINWLMAVIAVFGLVSASGAAGWYWWRSGRPLVAGADESPPLVPHGSGPKGLGGWLVLVGFGLCTGPFAMLVTIIGSWDSYFSQATWQAVAMPQGASYHPVYAPLLMFELLGNIIVLVSNLLLVALFFSQRRVFPRTYIVFLCGNAIYLVADAVLGNFIPEIASKPDPAAARDIARAIVGATIWSSYMLKSERVKATFVK